MIDAADLLSLGQLAGPALAAYVSCRVGIASALATAREAKQDAARAHHRIDHLITLNHHHRKATP